MLVLSMDQIKTAYPDEWVLLKPAEAKGHQSGEVLLHGKDYLELCYKSSEVAKGFLTKMLFTGEPTKNRKWVKSIRLQEWSFS